MNRLIDPDEVEAFYLESALQGWAGGNNGHETADLPGFFETRHARGNFLSVDHWTTDPLTHHTLGHTYIWHLEKCIWMMSYGGYYPTEALSFLRTTLKKTYENGVFHGARGPEIEVEGSLVYLNKIKKGASKFTKFRGEELIIDIAEKKVLGSHEFHGHFLA